MNGSVLQRSNEGKYRGLTDKQIHEILRTERRQNFLLKEACFNKIRLMVKGSEFEDWDIYDDPDLKIDILIRFEDELPEVMEEEYSYKDADRDIHEIYGIDHLSDKLAVAYRDAHFFKYSDNLRQITGIWIIKDKLKE